MIAIIPARGGSKRIPGKNIRSFLGHPVIEYSIRAALQSGCFDRVMVSTDSEEIATVARKCGAWVPFLRSEATSNDFATTADVVTEVLDRLEEQQVSCDSFAVIYATAPFLTAGTLQRGAALLAAGRAAAFTCVEYSYPVQRSLLIEDDRVRMAEPQYLTARSQDLQKHYHDAGQCYFSTVAAFRECGSLWGPDTAPILLSDLEVQDIDTPVDWQLAELKYRLLHPEGPDFTKSEPQGLKALEGSLRAFLLTPYEKLSDSMSEHMRQGRNLPEIRNRMTDRDEIPADNHRRFVASLADRADKAYFAVQYSYGSETEPETIGSVTLSDLGSGDLERGIWIFPESQGNGYARALMTLLYARLAELGYKHVYTRVRRDNDASRNLDLYMGAVEIDPARIPETMLPADPDMVYYRDDL